MGNRARNGFDRREMEAIVIKNILMVLSVLFLSGCATNPYQEFYTDTTHGRNILAAPYIMPPPKQPQLFRGANQDEDTQKMLEDGYFLIGYSQFNTSVVNNAYALDFAKKIHAAKVIVYSRYTNTVTEMIPMITPQTRTIETVNSGPSGFQRSGFDGGRRDGRRPGDWNRPNDMVAPSVSTTTITEFDTTYVPTAVNQYDYYATYWVQGEPPILGIRPRNLSADERQKLGTNKGIVVIAVITGSPAFKADIFKGDIVTKVNDQEVTDIKNFFHTIVPPLQGKTATLTILRNGEALTKQVEIGTRE